MTDLQELITRGRFIMANASERLKTFECVNGKRTAAEISKLTKRNVKNVHRDLAMLSNAELIQPSNDADGSLLRKDGYLLYEKVPLARTIPLRYFTSAVRPLIIEKKDSKNAPERIPKRIRKPNTLPVPTEQEILDIARTGETQIYEFKGAGADPRKVTKEIAAMLNTKQGGIIFYGIEDNGKVSGSDLTLQGLDQPLQNSVKNSISPAAVIQLHTVQVVGNPVIVIVVPPWNRRDVYHFDDRIWIRKGTNAFPARSEEAKKLYAQQFVI